MIRRISIRIGVPEAKGRIVHVSLNPYQASQRITYNTLDNIRFYKLIFSTLPCWKAEREPTFEYIRLERIPPDNELRSYGI